MFITALKFLFRFLLRRIHKVPVWVWIIILSAVLTLPGGLSFWFGWKIEPAPVFALAAGIGGFFGLAAWLFGFSLDNEWLGIPSRKKRP